MALRLPAQRWRRRQTRLVTRGSILYPVLSEQGKVLAWAGRDVEFEQREKEYQQLSAAERSGKDPPPKHRFPKGFHRGIELFGQQASRLQEPGYRDFITKHGLIIVEWRSACKSDPLRRGKQTHLGNDLTTGSCVVFIHIPHPKDEVSADRLAIIWEAEQVVFL